MQDYSEKRDFIRMTMACEMQIRQPESGTTQTVHLEDLSATGMRFFTPDELIEGSLLEVSIIPQKDLTPPMQAEIEVIRCTRLDDTFEVAASIRHIDPVQYPEAEAS